MRKWILLVLILGLGLSSYFYLFKGHRDIASEKAEVTMTAIQLQELYKKTPNNVFENTYLNKTIEVTGRVSSFEPKQITLNRVIFCQLSDSLDAHINIGSNINIKGRLIGYDELLEEVKLDQCYILN
ncbi:hypothetical protein KFZ70_16860 [Tamlana fucoidanivorans]|uniref:tRNA_anti-like n=1 Tax=Allotamlana fucoidanivorans TaxID=2583814 RepID=A0A5C4SJZ9_9FLAO|nr:hypothetical protein [Tamlana fucoidanivorans]TNJ43469.1 hypothetical protein FGF67_11150 [Tamlana fucoidanivorans]